MDENNDAAAEWIWIGQQGYCPTCADSTEGERNENNVRVQTGDHYDLPVDYCCNCGAIPGSDEIMPYEAR